MAETRVCGKCGVALSAYAPPGLCANCMLQQGLDPFNVSAALPGNGTPGVSRTGMASPSPSTTIRYFGDYELLEEIARGGMGIVYRARQVSLDRMVAIKMLLSGPLSSPELVKRFRAEASAAASLQHPNIVAIHEVGVHQDHQYFAMDFVEGQSLAKLLANGPLSAKRAAGYLKTIAEAIHYAHERGLLHRDLKPSNVLIDGADQPRVTDFGLARRLDGDSELTLTGQVLGSPNYMPPEQAGAKRGQLSRRSDVYAMGAMLYHLLTGRPPFVGETIADTLAQAIDTDPVPPRLLNPSVPRDLETLCLKCLQKESGKRYATAQALADELSRFLGGEPIQARPVSAFEKLWRWSRRKPGLMGLGAATVLLLLALAIVSPIAAFRINRERQRADQNLYAADMHEAETALEKGDLGRARQLVEAHQPRPKETDLRGFEWRLLWRRSRGDEVETLRGYTNFVRSAFFNSSGDLLVSRSFDNTLKVWDLATRRECFTMKDVSALGGFSADGKILAFSTVQGSVKLCEARTGLALTSIEKAGDLVALLDGGKTVVTTGKTFLAKVWDTGTGEEKLVLPGSGGRNTLGPEWGLAVSIGPDGKLLAVVDPKFQGITIWDLPAKKVLTHLPDKRALTFLQFSREGKTLATGSFNGVVNFWDLTMDGKPPVSIKAHRHFVAAAEFSPEGNILATASEDQTVKLWDLETGVELDTLRGHESGVWTVAFSADGKRLASGGLDQTIKLWDLERRQAKAGLTGTVPPLAWTPDSTMLAAGFTNGTVKIWDAATLRLHQILPGVGVSNVLAFSQDGKTVSTRRTDGKVAFCEVATGKVKREVQTPLAVENWSPVVMSPDRQMMSAGYASGTVGLWEMSSGKNDLLTGHTRLMAITFSPDSGTLISGDVEGVIEVWDVARRQRTASITAHALRVVSLAVSPDGKTLASGSTDHMIKLWDLKSKKPLATLSGHMRSVWALAFAPDGTTLASGSGDRTVRFWSVPRQCEVATLNLYPRSEDELEEITFVEFSPDGNTLATITRNGTLKLLRASPFSETDTRLTSRR